MNTGLTYNEEQDLNNMDEMEKKENDTALAIIRRHIPNGIVNIKGKGDGKPQYKAEIEVIKKCMCDFAQTLRIQLDWRDTMIKGKDEEINQLRKDLEKCSKDYNELYDQSQIWKEESGK